MLAEYGELGAYGVVLGERRVVGPEGAVHLVGGDVVEAERPRRPRPAQTSARAAFEQLVRADHVGVDERVGTVDGAVDVRLGGEVDDRVELCSASSRSTRSAVADVALDEAMPGSPARRPGWPGSRRR